MVRAAIALLLLMLLPSGADAQQRIALLIGNEGYASEIGRLANPHNDVGLLEKALKGLGFEVVTVSDAGLGALTRAVNAYARRLQSAGPDAVGFFYYSGHGASDGTTNYLIPIDVKTTETGELWDQSLRLTEITRKLKTEAGNATHFIVFDACRNTLKLTQPGSRAVVQSKGFIPVAQENGMLIAYATAEGGLASDVGSGAGPYAKALAEEIVKPGVEAVVMFRAVQRRVRAAIRQEPYLGFNALGDVYFAGKADTVASTGEAERAWAAVKDTKSTEVLQSFIERYKDTIYADLARAQKRDLEARQKMASIALEMEAKRLEWAEKQRQEEEHKKRADELKQTAGTARSDAPANQPQVTGPTWWEKLTGGASSAPPAKSAPPEQVVIATPPAQSTPQAPPPARCDGVETQVGTEKRCLKSKDSFKDCDTCPEMVVVPAGEFMMGSNENDDEKPVHKVTIAKPLAVGKFDVTFAEWDACVSAGGCTDKPSDQGFGRGKRPVINVSWDLANKEYLPWLSRKSGKTYRLPTEAEWEYAARGVTSASAVHTAYPWGNNIGKNRANCHRCGSEWDSYLTAPVGSFKPNAFGLYDMHGNVDQLVQDCYHNNYQGAPTDGSAWAMGDCSRHIARGGNWYNFSQDSRSASRSLHHPSEIVKGLGFRVARNLTP
jgi:formylglycine-generating enzyme required for sulfatase activity